MKRQVEMKRILIPRFDTLGDIVLLEGFVEALIQRFPEAEIVMLVREGNEQLAPLFPQEVRWTTTVLNPYQEADESTIGALSNLLRTVAANSWDMVLVTTYNRTWLDNALAARLTGTRRIALGKMIAMRSSILTLFHRLHLETDDYFDEVVFAEEHLHETEKYQILWETLFPETQKLSLPRLSVSRKYSDRGGQFQREVGLPENNYFLCLPGGTQHTTIKGWPLDCFAELIWRVTHTFQLQPLLVGHISEEPVVDSVAHLVERRGIKTYKWLGGDGEVSVLAALMKRSRFYVGNDTGPMHIAAALGVPTVGVFGGGYWPRFLPVGAHTIGVAGDLPCFGCDWNCVFGDAPCVGLVTVEDVLQALRTVLNGNGEVINVVRCSKTISNETSYLIRKVLKRYRESEADRAERLEIIRTLEARLAESDADRAAKAELIDRLHAQLKTNTMSKELSCNEECQNIVKRQIELLELFEEGIRKLDNVHTCVAARTEETLTGPDGMPFEPKTYSTVTKSSYEKEIENLRLICDARLKVIEEQKNAIEHLLRWRLKERMKRAFSPKIGVLYHYDPMPLRIPKRYLSAKSDGPRPTISLVTPSFNHADFIDRTIKSVLEQDYPKLEYIIQDGGSTDETVKILKEFERSLKRWESVQDKGQPNALNLGFGHSTGEIMAYLNSDDLLLPGALHYVADYFTKHPDVDVVYGHRILIDEHGREIGRWVLPPHEDDILSWADYVPQETLFWRRRIWDKVGGYIDESFQFAMDWDLLLRFRDAGAKFVCLPRFLGAFRIHPHQKTSSVIEGMGKKEMAMLRERCHGRAVSDEEIAQNTKWYLRKHVILDWRYRIGLLKY